MKKFLCIALSIVTIFSIFTTTVWSQPLATMNVTAETQVVSGNRQLVVNVEIPGTVEGVVVVVTYDSDNQSKQIVQYESANITASIRKVSVTLPSKEPITASEITKVIFVKDFNNIENLANCEVIAETKVHPFTPVDGAKGEYILVQNSNFNGTNPEYMGTLPKNPTSGDGIVKNQLNTTNTETHKVDYIPPFFVPSSQSTDLSPNNEVNNSANNLPNIGSVTGNEKVGYKRNFSVLYNNSEEYDLQFELKAIGTKCFVWTETASINKDGVVSELPGNAVTMDKINEIKNTFDTNIVGTVEKSFGDATYYDTNITNILLYDIQDGYNPGVSGQYFAGYFYSADYFEKIEGGTGNLADIINIDTWPSIGAKEDISTLAHELQHSANYGCTGNYLQTHEENSAWAFMNEAMSMAAERLIFGPSAVEDRIRYYNDTGKYGSNDIKNGHSLTTWMNELANYSLSYLFGQYLRTLTEGKVGGGEVIFTTILNKGVELKTFNANTIVAAVNAVCGTNYTFETLHSNFRIALVAKDKMGPYGFKGEKEFDVLETKLADDTVELLPPGAAIFKKVPRKLDGSIGTFRPYGNGANIKFYGIELRK